MRHARLHGPRVLLLTALVVAAPRPAFADWQFTPFFGFTFKGNTTLVDLEDAVGRTHWNFGGAVTVLGRWPIGAEAYFVYTPGLFNHKGVGGPPTLDAGIDSSRSFAFMGNAVLAAPRSWNEYGLRPFISGGLGALHATEIDKTTVFTVKRTIPAYNIGGGAIGFLTDNTGLRFDLRFIRNLLNQDEPLAFSQKLHLRYWTASIGVVIKK